MVVRLSAKQDISFLQDEEKEIFGYSLAEGVNNDLKTQLIIEDPDFKGAIILWHDGDKGQIELFYIKKDEQNKGYGYVLLKEALAYLEKKGIKIVTLEVKANNEKALHLYQKMGFKEKLIKKNFYKGGIDAIYMVKGDEK